MILTCAVCTVLAQDCLSTHHAPGCPEQKGKPHMDIVVLAIGALFFVLAFAYTKACDGL